MAIGKRLRFEVFKRDKFTCQYCGQKAPDVILHIDHIKPVKHGGLTEISNLITSCQSCNLGKGAIPLTDQQAVDKMRKQAEELQERREQIGLMMKWVEGGRKIDSLMPSEISKILTKKTGYGLNDLGLRNIGKLIKKYNYQQVVDAVDIAFDRYYTPNENNKGEENRSWNLAFDKIGGVLFNKKTQTDNPELSKLYYAGGILKNRLGYYDKKRGFLLLKQALDAGAAIDSLIDLAKSAKHWSGFREAIESFCRKQQEAKNADSK